METPPDAFLPPKTFDPLITVTTDLFWYTLEPCFRPFQERDLATLDDIVPTVHAEFAAPLAQRLVAALLDEGTHNTNTNGSNNNDTVSASVSQRQPLWLPGSMPCLKAFNEVYESRVRAELEDLGVLPPVNDAGSDSSSIVQMERMRLEAWNLRHIAASNTGALARLHSETYSEVQSQSARRAQKRAWDSCEVKYLKKMIECATKKNKSRFSKLLREMHPNHELPIGTPLPGLLPNGPVKINTNSDHNSRDRERERERKKKKRKSSHHDRTKTGSHSKLELSKTKKVRD